MNWNEKLDPKQYILIKGARVHNLKNVNVVFERNKLIAVTGLSGSGKSSLAFDTLYAEGQRRYVESLSSYARQFMGKLEKPEVDYIRGISPAVAIKQSTTSTNPRSTVGTATEIYDYLRVLYTRIGKTISPISGDEVKADTIEDVISSIRSFEEGTRFMVTFVPDWGRRHFEPSVEILSQQGYSRLWDGEKTFRLSDAAVEKKGSNWKKWAVVVDRMAYEADDEDLQNRIADSVQLSFFEGHGSCSIIFPDAGKKLDFSNAFERDGIRFEEPSIHLFSFNNPYGACPSCEGFGSIIGFDEDLVIPNPKLSVYQGAVAPWKGEKMSVWKDKFIEKATEIEFPIHKAYRELNAEQRKILWNGQGKIKGITNFFNYLEEKSYKIQNRVMLSRYRGKTKCPSCDGLRLRKESNFVKFNGKSITELAAMPIYQLSDFFDNLTLSDYEKEISKRLLIEIRNRLKYVMEVGLGYLTLNRSANTLSGGESQRINLATSLGSSLVGSMYILDEPSIGLHPRDTERLIRVIKNLRDLGNTVIVVEHDEEIMRAADQIVDIGPGAGQLGGEVVFSGTFDSMMKMDTLTADYLSGKKEIPVPEKRREPKNFIELKGVSENNLKDIDVKFPLGCMTVVTGVSGSGKSTLVNKILFRALQREILQYGDRPGKFDEMIGDLSEISYLEFVDQNPIGKSSRSNPVTYLKAYDDIRDLYSKQKNAQARGYKAKHFSFNVAGGRCDECEGEGTTTISMQFMADVHLTCESCGGKRFKKEVLEVRFADKNISDILDMDVKEAISFFRANDQQKIAEKIQPLMDVGLDYVKLGQSSNTLSGGEAQRVKLAFFLSRSNRNGNNLYIFDEPTTGLHFHDIHKLLESFYALMEKGHSIILVEHHPDVIKCADWIIDLGPEGGDKGGELVYQGPVEGLQEAENSTTRTFIREKLMKK